MSPTLYPSSTMASTPSKHSQNSGRPSEATASTVTTQSPGAKKDTDLGSKPTTSKAAKRKRNRNRKRRHRRQSFIAPEEPVEATSLDTDTIPVMARDQTQSQPAFPFYKHERDLSSTSLESDALLDHRNQPMMRQRRESRLAQSFRPGSLSVPSRIANITPSGTRTHNVEDDSDASEAVGDRTPLMRTSSTHPSVLARYGADSKSSPNPFQQRRGSGQTISSRGSPRSPKALEQDRDYDINNPPSMPSSPKMGAEMNYDDAVVTGAEFDFSLAKSIDNRMDSLPRSYDMVINVDSGNIRPRHSPPSTPPSPQLPPQDALRRRRTVNLPVEEDVCFPTEEVSVLAEEDSRRTSREDERRRRRAREWPDLSVLEEWSRGEKEERTGDFRTKKISEPMFIEGRLRPQYRLWRREEDETPYRFTYFNEEFQSTIHAQTISELVQPGGSFRELFIPDPPELEDSSDDEEVQSSISNQHSEIPIDHSRSGNTSDNNNNNHNNNHHGTTNGARAQVGGSILLEPVPEVRTDASPSWKPHPPAKKKRYGPRPTFWLDVLSPTDAEMRVIAKAFGIHALTAEDIMMQEAREKVELFRNYYFVNYRTFEQDPNSENYLEPVNMYIIVFREGILSFHFSQTPHPANVRRRVRQLMDYLILSADWISYALIDDITDVFGPLIQSIEDEVDEIDEKIMSMIDPGSRIGTDNKEEDESVDAAALVPGEMLRRVGECRRKVMGMYRLLSNKADVVKGFAKRCNEQWEVAPKSEIGLYLGDIQDHIMTMTSSLTYYETILSRAHSNYLAQINILMNERQERTADVLGKLTVLGTIVLPLNIICGLWGMNVKVPGQDENSPWWFWSITASLFLFAMAAVYIAKRVYKIV